MNFLKKLFKSKDEAELKAIIRIQQNALQMEIEKREYVERLLIKIAESEKVEMPMEMVLEIWDYIHMDEIKNFEE
jgi:hypothetical protein